MIVTPPFDVIDFLLVKMISALSVLSKGEGKHYEETDISRNYILKRWYS